MNLPATLLTTALLVFVLVTGIGNKTRLATSSSKLSQKSIKNLYAPITFHDKKKPCLWLKHLKRQYKLCRKDQDLSEVLLSARDLAITSCEEQFRYNRWNCSRTRKTFKNVYRETALLYAMASSALTYTIARACASGRLINCNCEKEKDYRSNVEAWKWGFCSDNVNYAKKFTKKLLQIKNRGDDLNQIFRHDSQIGIDIVAQHVKQKCRCPGLSGSCSIKICWKQLEPFKKISLVLKDKYQRALLTEIDNSAGEHHVNKRSVLFYLLKSPTFCKSTIGRRCLDKENCANLCCGRGYNTIRVRRIKRCNCRCVDKSCVRPQCDICTVEEEEYSCK